LDDNLGKGFKDRAGKSAAMRRTMKLASATGLFLFFAMPLLHAQNETPAQKGGMLHK
jgi:hypothetical protein